MKKKKHKEISRALISATGLAILLAILILVNVIASFANLRWDTTENKLYSLSKGTKNILAELKKPVIIKFFFSSGNSNLPNSIRIYGKRVLDFLSEYEHQSDGMVRIETYDPEMDSEEEEWAKKYGLRGIPISAGEKIYCGIVALAEDQEERIEFLNPTREKLLEYEVTRSINRVQSPQKRVIGVISSLPVFESTRGPGGNPWFFIDELRKTYEVRRVPLTAVKLDPEIDMLLIAYPKEILPKLQYAIDQFILSGKNALIFLDPFCISDTQQYSQFQDESKTPYFSLDMLLGAWGVSMDFKKSVADLDHPTKVRTRDNATETNPLFISASTDSFNKNEVITSELEQMLFPIAGAIKKKKDSPYEFQPLVVTGKNASLIKESLVKSGASSIWRDLTPSGEALNLIVRIGGKFKTAFPGGVPYKENDKKSSPQPGPDHKDTGKDNSMIILVSDADMLYDQFYVTRREILGYKVGNVFNDNLNFLLNACEILTGAEELIQLRCRGRFERPFTRVMELQRKARQKWQAKEKELMEQIEATNRKLRELQQYQGESQKLIMSPEQEAEIAKFRQKKIEIKEELKEVRRNLKADIVALGNTLKAINIFLVPLLVSIAGLIYGLYRQIKVRQR